MNWEAIGAIAEIVGALAVVATLAFLAMQIRSANKYAELEAKRFTTDGMSAFCDKVVESLQTASVLYKGRAGLENLTPEEVLQYEHLHLRLLNSIEDWHHQITEISQDGDYRKGQIENIKGVVEGWIDHPGSREVWTAYEASFPLVKDLINSTLNELTRENET